MTAQPVGTDVLAAWESVVRAVTGTHRAVLGTVERRGVAGPEFSALHLLYRSPERRLPMSRLARDLQMTSGGFTRLADRLGRDGLIDRRNSADDRRVIFAVLTDKGTDLVTDLLDEYYGGLREHVLDVLGPDGVLALADTVAVLTKRAHDEAAEGAGEFRLPDSSARVPHGRRASDDTMG
jgi:DNA-binding MarR family transcriptional regulator